MYKYSTIVLLADEKGLIKTFLYKEWNLKRVSDDRMYYFVWSVAFLNKNPSLIMSSTSESDKLRVYYATIF